MLGQRTRAKARTFHAHRALVHCELQACGGLLQGLLLLPAAQASNLTKALELTAEFAHSPDTFLDNMFHGFN